MFFFIRLFTKRQLLKNYMNIGSNSSNLNMNNSYYILGLNDNVAILNVGRSLFNLKKKINFVIKFSKYCKNLNFLFINTNTNKILASRFEKICTSLKCSFFFGNWWNGLLKSFKKYIRYSISSKTKKFKFFWNQYPKFTVYIDSLKFGSINTNNVPINREINNVSMKNIMFFNSYLDINTNPNAILFNTRTYLNNLFLFYLFIKIIKKCIFISKKKFVLSVLNDYSGLKLQNYKLFYEYLFCLKNKKNLLKNVLWNDDLN